MMKLTAVLLILSLPALVTADVNRLRPSRGLEEPDALCWNMQTHRPEPTAVPLVMPSWASIRMSNPTVTSRSSIQCPTSAPQHVTRRLSQPECASYVKAPVLWPHAPRADEQKTADREPRPKQTQAQDRQPAR